MLPGSQFQILVVITDQKLGVMGDDPKVEEELAPGVVAFTGSYQDDGDIVAEVINAPEKYPIILLSCHIEVLAGKGKGRGELRAVIEGELVVVRKPPQLLIAGSPGRHGREMVLSPQVSEGEAVEMISENGLGISPMGVDGEVPGTRFAQETKRFAPFRLSNNCVG